MKKKSSESSQPEKLIRVRDCDIKMTAEMQAQLEALDALTDDQIDFSDIPEQLDWSNAVRGKFYRPIKQPVNLRLDADVLAWFKSLGGKYQSRINEALREYMQAQLTKQKPL